MIATFKSENTGILNHSKIKASISVQTMVSWKGEGIGCILLKGLGLAPITIAILHHWYSYFNKMLSERPSLLFQFILLLKSVQLSLIPSLHSLKQILTRNKKHSSKLWRCLEKNQFSNLSPSEREHNGQLYKAATKNDNNYRIQKTIKFMNKINKSSDSKNNLKFLLLIRSIPL